MAAGAANSSAAGARSTIRPAYITATSSHVSATTPRSCVISRIAVPSRVRRSARRVEDLRLDRDVERRGRLVGDHERRARRPAPSRSSPAAACRRKADADIRRAARSGSAMPHKVEHLERPAPRSRAGVTSRCNRTRLGDLVADR